MNIPSHHQADFFSALRTSGLDLLVRYYDKDLLRKRQEQGWKLFELSSGEAFIEPELSSLSTIPDYKERIHIIPGYGAKFLRQLAQHLSRQSVSWVHWSERSHLGLRWYLGYPRKRWYGRLVKHHALGAFAQGVLATKDFLRWGIPIEKISFLPYTIRALNPEVERNQNCLDFLEGRNAFLFLGAMCRRKAPDLLLKAFAAVDEVKRKNWVLLFVGKDQSLGKYQKMAITFGLENSTYFIGTIASNQISSVLKCARSLVLPSRFDGWGVVLNEAASMGKALIASDRCGAAWHLIHDRENGFRFKSGSVNELKNAMLNYMDCPSLVKLHGENSSKIFEHEFTPEVNAKRFIDTLQGWLNRPKMDSV